MLGLGQTSGCASGIPCGSLWRALERQINDGRSSGEAGRYSCVAARRASFEDQTDRARRWQADRIAHIGKADIRRRDYCFSDHIYLAVGAGGRSGAARGCWTNFADRRDVVAVEAKLADDYEAKDLGIKVVDVPVINAYKIRGVTSIAYPIEFF